MNKSQAVLIAAGIGLFSGFVSGITVSYIHYQDQMLKMYSDLLDVYHDVLKKPVRSSSENKEEVK